MKGKVFKKQFHLQGKRAPIAAKSIRETRWLREGRGMEHFRKNSMEHFVNYSASEQKLTNFKH